MPKKDVSEELILSRKWIFNSPAIIVFKLNGFNTVAS